MLIRSGMGMQLSGSVGGVVASRNSGGAYLRNRTVPVNPNSVRQQAARAVFAEAAILWRGLTDDERSGWVAYAVETPLLNRLGESITVSGFAHYVRSNAFRLNAGQPLVDVAPLVPGLSTLGSFVSIELDTANTMTVVLDGATAVPIGLVGIGPPVSPGVSFFKGPFSLAGAPVLLPDGFVDAALDTAGFRYGPFLVGQRRFVRIAGSDFEGRLSNVIIVPVEVTTTP